MVRLYEGVSGICDSSWPHYDTSIWSMLMPSNDIVLEVSGCLKRRKAVIASTEKVDRLMGCWTTVPRVIPMI